MQDGKEVTYDVTKDGESGAAVTEGMEETEISQTPRTAEEQKQNGQQKHNTQQAETGAELVQEFQPEPDECQRRAGVYRKPEQLFTGRYPEHHGSDYGLHED